MDWWQLFLGLIVLLAPGAALVLALAPRMDWAKTTFIVIVTAASVTPALMYALNYFLGVPLTAANAVVGALFMTALAGASYASSRLARAWD